MYRHFDSDFFSNNRRRLRELFSGTAPIVLTANGLLQRNGDSAFSFRQDSSFWYLTGVPDPDVVLVMDKSQDFLILPNYGEVKELFDGAQNGDVLREVSGVDMVLDEKEGWKKLHKRLGKVKHVATLPVPPAYSNHYGMYTNPARAKMVERLKEGNAAIELLDISRHLARMRMVKQPEELAAMGEAIDITSQVIKRIAKKARYEYEYEIEADITAHFRKHGAQAHAFAPIVSAGERACVLHDTDNNGEIRSNQFVVIDIGAEVDNYSADITRTLHFGKPTKRQRDVYAAVLDVQNYALSLLKPGALLRENEQLIEQYMDEKLREIGLIKTINHDTVRKYYPHATSHYLGLDTHDVGEYDRPLEENVVITVEPGIYIPQEGIGVRIEDDVLITANGYEIMSKKLPRELS